MAQPANTVGPEPAGLERKLGTWDAVSLIVGIVVGTSIFKTTPFISQQIGGFWESMTVWTLGGVLALVGAFCYAELGAAYPHSGGDYVYLTRAYGRWVGFLFGWAQLAVILTGSTAIMAFAFADYAAPLFVAVTKESPFEGLKAGMAVAAVGALTLVNMMGVVFGKRTQNVLTAAKVIGLGAVIVVGFMYGDRSEMTARTSEQFFDFGQSFSGFGLAMILVLYAYGGWNDAAFIAGEVRDPKKNLPRALILGIVGIMVIYLLVNAAYILGLGYEGLKNSSGPAADVLELRLGNVASACMRVLVMISALGAINGLTFTGSRVYVALGQDHGLFRLLGRWNAQLGAPFWALLAHAVFTVVLILAVGTPLGRNLIDQIVASLKGRPIPWNNYGGGFDTLVAGTSPVFWLFFLLTGMSLFILREKDRDLVRPYSVPWYPLVPLVFCNTCLYMLYSSITYAKYLVLIGLIPLAAGVPLYWISNLFRERK